MEKLLKVEFFKYQGFYTKTDGLTFIKSTPPLVEFIKQKNLQVTEFTDEKLREFEDEMEKYEETKKVFIKKCKLEKKVVVAEKTLNTHEDLKDQLRAEMREEIRLEMEKEKEQILRTKYAQFMPTFSNSDLESILTIPKLFTDFITKLNDGSKILEPTDKNILLGMIRNSEQYVIGLLSIKKTLEELVL